MKVADVMTRKVLTVEVGTPVVEAIRLMAEHGVNSIPVVRKGFYEGIVKVEDILSLAVRESVDISNLKVEDVMTPYPVFVSPSTDLTEAARIMVERKVGHLLVVDGRKVVGIISDFDVIETFSGLL